MAAATPTTAELQALIATLQTQVAALTSMVATTSTTSTLTPAVGVFADTPQLLLDTKDLLDYAMKRGCSIYEQGCKTLDNTALSDGFSITADQTVVFVEALTHRAGELGWNVGSKNITNFTNAAGKDVDIIKEYGQIDEQTVKTACKQFCKTRGADVATRAKQNNTMMATCLGESLMADVAAKLLTFCTKYTFNGVEYAPLMYKIIMQIATINTVATTKTLCDNLNNLRMFAATVQGDIHKINGKFDKNYTQFFSLEFYYVMRY